jgi:hypothetical protein
MESKTNRKEIAKFVTTDGDFKYRSLNIEQGMKCGRNHCNFA